LGTLEIGNYIILELIVIVVIKIALLGLIGCYIRMEIVGLVIVIVAVAAHLSTANLNLAS
jgi:uncharacterized membrane protein YeiB